MDAFVFVFRKKVVCFNRTHFFFNRKSNGAHSKKKKNNKETHSNFSFMQQFYFISSLNFSETNLRTSEIKEWKCRTNAKYRHSIYFTPFYCCERCNVNHWPCVKHTHTHTFWSIFVCYFMYY